MMQKRRSSELPGLTGLRGLLAMAVLLSHLGLCPYGWVAVDGFFVLSGFVLAHVYGRQPIAIRAFFWARFARLMPATWAAAVICALTTPWHWGSADLVRAAAPPFLIAFRSPIDPPLWSLGIEWWLYLAFPVLVRLTSAISRPGRLACAAICFCGAGVLAWASAPQGGFDLGLLALLRGLLPFLAGMLLLPLLVRHLHLIRWLDVQPIRWLGDVSLPFYLLQFAAFYLTLGSLWSIPLTLAMAGAVHHWIERPARRWLRALDTKKPAQIAPANP